MLGGSLLPLKTQAFSQSQCVPIRRDLPGPDLQTTETLPLLPSSRERLKRCRSMNSFPAAFAFKLLTFSDAFWRTMIPSQFSTFQTGKPDPIATPSGSSGKLTGGV